jgi:alpha-N-acetylglucosaminidase
LAVDASPTFRKAVEAFLSCSDELITKKLYRNDLIELVSQSVGGSVDLRLKEACDAHKADRFQERDTMSSEALDMLCRIDALMNVRVDRRLEEWVSEARSWGTTSDMKTYYDENARLLITYWGWLDLNDYGSKVWAGLIRDYYASRWRDFFQSLQVGAKPHPDTLEETWLSVPYQPSQPLKVVDLAKEARQMLDVCAKWS